MVLQNSDAFTRFTVQFSHWRDEMEGTWKRYRWGITLYMYNQLIEYEKNRQLALGTVSLSVPIIRGTLMPRINTCPPQGWCSLT